MINNRVSNFLCIKGLSPREVLLGNAVALLEAGTRERFLGLETHP